MIRLTKTVFHTLKVFLIFTGCTILFYYAIVWFNQEYQQMHRYDEPSGAAIKVNGNNTEETEKYSWRDRILLFYLNGE
ncbi:MAG TPA: YqzK family protein [Niallia sp.]|nr:YqzK family protein [Niallia sp.]